MTWIIGPVLLFMVPFVVLEFGDNSLTTWLRTFGAAMICWSAALTWLLVECFT